MTTTVAKISCALDLSLAGMSVKDYVARYDAIYNKGQNELKVFGTFLPDAVADGVEYFYGCTMQDGSTIDLSGKTGPWSTTSSSQNRNTVSFADGATVTIDAHGRRFPNGEFLMTWKQAPSNLDGLTFRLDDASVARGYRVKACAGGLRIYRGLAIFIR